MSLDKLVVDADEVRSDALSNKELFRLLEPYVTIEEDGVYGNVHFHDDYDELPAEKQVIVCFFCTEALYRLGITTSQSLDIVEVFNNFKLDEGTHYPHIRNLEQDGILWRKNKQYKLDSFYIEDAIEMVET